MMGHFFYENGKGAFLALYNTQFTGFAENSNDGPRSSSTGRDINGRVVHYSASFEDATKLNCDIYDRSKNVIVSVSSSSAACSVLMMRESFALEGKSARHLKIWSADRKNLPFDSDATVRVFKDSHGSRTYQVRSADRQISRVVQRPDGSKLYAPASSAGNITQ